MEKKKIGISIGDINGVGLEVILKTVSDKKILDQHGWFQPGPELWLHLSKSNNLPSFLELDQSFQ